MEGEVVRIEDVVGSMMIYFLVGWRYEKYGRMEDCRYEKV